MLLVKLIKSPIGNTPKNRATVKSLGLNKVGSSRTHNDSKQIRGMIHAIQHLVSVEEVDGSVEKRTGRGAKGLVAPAASKPKAAAKAAPKAKAPAAEAKPKRTTKKNAEEAK